MGFVAMLLTCMCNSISIVLHQWCTKYIGVPDSSLGFFTHIDLHICSCIDSSGSPKPAYWTSKFLPINLLSSLTYTTAKTRLPKSRWTQNKWKARRSRPLIRQMQGRKLSVPITLSMAALFVPCKEVYYATLPLGSGHYYFRDRPPPRGQKLAKRGYENHVCREVCDHESGGRRR